MIVCLTIPSETQTSSRRLHVAHTWMRGETSSSRCPWRNYFWIICLTYRRAYSIAVYRDIYRILRYVVSLPLYCDTYCIIRFSQYRPLVKHFGTSCTLHLRQNKQVCLCHMMSHMILTKTDVCVSVLINNTCEDVSLRIDQFNKFIIVSLSSVELWHSI